MVVLDYWNFRNTYNWCRSWGGLGHSSLFFLRRHCLFVPTATYMGFVLDFAFQSDIAMLTVEGLTGGLKRMSRGRARKRLVTQYSHAIHVGLHYFKCRMTNGFFPFGGLIRTYLRLKIKARWSFFLYRISIYLLRCKYLYLVRQWCRPNRNFWKGTPVH